MTITNTPYVESCMTIAKGLNDIAIKNQMPLARVNEIYTQFNYVLYKEERNKARNTVRGNEDFGRYKFSIEEKALELTEGHFNTQKN